MSIGQLSTRFAFEQAPEFHTASNQRKLDWAAAETVAERWGRFLPKGSKDYVNAAQVWADVDWIVECRGRAAITSAMRVRQGRRYFDILGVFAPDGRAPAEADMLKVACKEIAG
jgi:head-tail adaptor